MTAVNDKTADKQYMNIINMCLSYLITKMSVH